MKRITLDGKTVDKTLRVDTFASTEYTQRWFKYNNGMIIYALLTELRTKVTIMCTTGLLSLP